MKYPWLLGLMMCLFGSQAMAQTPLCDGLSGAAADVAKKTLASAYLYDCCDQTIAKCLTSAPRCTLATRLANEVCRQAALGKTSQEIQHALDQRAMTMSDLVPPAKIALTPDHVWGNPQAKVVLSVYLCGRCPYCSRYVPELIKALEQAGLKDKVALNLRLFPIKSHEHSTEAALAVEAAAKLGQAWPYLLQMYQNFDQFSVNGLVTSAQTLGLDAEKFAALQQDKGVREAVVASKKEGLTNQVEATPTFYLNGRKIQGAFDVESILSMVEEASER